MLSFQDSNKSSKGLYTMPLLKTGILAAHYKKSVNFTKIPGVWLPPRLALFLLVEHFRNQDMVGLCYPTALKNTFVGLKGYMTKNNTCPLLPYCARSLKMFEGACKNNRKWTSSWLPVTLPCNLHYNKSVKFTVG